MTRFPTCTLLAALLAATGCQLSEPNDVVPPAAEVPAPARLTQPNVVAAPAPAPTAPGTYTSMTPPFTQHTPPRPHTRTTSAVRDSATGPVVPATPPLAP